MFKSDWQAKLTHEIYIVSAGMQGGYMPDSTGYSVSREDAINSALWEKENYLEDESFFAVGNIRKDGYIAIEAKADGEHSKEFLGYVIELSRVSLGYLGLSDSDIADKTLEQVVDELNQRS